MNTAWRVVLGSALLLGILVNCGGDSGPADQQSAICQPGLPQSCTGDQGCEGQALCSANGLSLGACDCGAGGTSGAGANSGGSASLLDASIGNNSLGGTAGNAGGASSVDAGADAAACNDQCDPNTITTCVDGSITTCFLDPLSGCAVLYQFDCGLGSCADENHCRDCVDECDIFAAASCREGQLGSCVGDQEGCLKWEATSDCPEGFCATDQACGTCQDDCTTAGAVECTGGESRVCVTDNFGCLNWSPMVECPTLQCQTVTQCWIGYSAGQRGTPAHDEAHALHLDTRGAAAIVGFYHRFGDVGYRPDSDAYLQVRDATDMLLKDAIWGSDADDSALAVAVDSEFNHLVVGWTTGNIGSNAFKGGRDAFLAKWGDDPMEPIWLRQWGTTENDTARAVAVNAQNEVFVAGSTAGQLGDEHSGAEDLFVTKWDSAGNRLWTNQWGSAESDVITAAVIDSAGHVWIAGRTAGTLGSQSSAGGYDAFVAELDSEGAVLQLAQFGTAYGESAEAIAIDQSGNVFVAGVTQGDLNGEQSSGGIDSFVVKFDSTLSALWTRLWGTANDDLGHALALSSAGWPHIAVTVQATADLACDPGQIEAVGWDADGVSTITESWDSCGAESATGIAVKPDGQVLIVGWTEGDLVNESRGGRDIVSITLQP